MVENDGRKCARMDGIANNKTQQTHTYLFPLLLERMDNRNERTELFFCVVTRINCGKKRNLRKRNETKTRNTVFLSSFSLRSSLSSINLLISSPNFSSLEKNTFGFSFIFSFNFFFLSIFFSLLVFSLSLSKKKKKYVCLL